MFLSKLTAAIYGVSSIKQELDVHRFNPRLYQLYKVAKVFLAFTEEETEDQKGEVPC